jgi:[NiFe] hydrogenase diaphorase moiety large subunit
MRPKCAATVDSIVAAFAADRSRLLDIVEAVQHHSGYVSNEAVRAIATGLGIHPVEVEDMLSFYAFFDRQPRGRYRIRLSKTPISFMKGARAVADAFEEALGITVGGTSADGTFTLQWTSDIGMADQEPSALINGMVLTELTPNDVPQIVAALRQAVLPKATIRSSLVQCGPLLSGPRGRGDGITAALARSPEKVIEEITAAKLRGRRLSHRHEMAVHPQGDRRGSLRRLQRR